MSVYQTTPLLSRDVMDVLHQRASRNARLVKLCGTVEAHARCYKNLSTQFLFSSFKMGKLCIEQGCLCIILRNQSGSCIDLNAMLSLGLRRRSERLLRLLFV